MKLAALLGTTLAAIAVVAVGLFGAQSAPPPQKPVQAVSYDGLGPCIGC